MNRPYQLLIKPSVDCFRGLLFTLSSIFGIYQVMLGVMSQSPLKLLLGGGLILYAVQILLRNDSKHYLDASMGGMLWGMIAYHSSGSFSIISMVITFICILYLVKVYDGY